MADIKLLDMINIPAKDRSRLKFVFDDSLFETERQTLEAYYMLDGYYHMDPNNPESAKLALEYLKSIN